MEHNQSYKLSFRSRFSRVLSDINYTNKVISFIAALISPLRMFSKLRFHLNQIYENLHRIQNNLNHIKNELFLLKINREFNNTEDAILLTQQNLRDHEENIQAISFDTTSGLLNWPEILDERQRHHGFKELLRLFSLSFVKENIVNKASSCWTLLAIKNCDQLLTDGYNNFKRTIALNYFNFLIQKGDSQIQAVESFLSQETIESCHQQALNMPHDLTFHHEQTTYYYFVFLLWEYTKQLDQRNYLDKLEEPKEGNPILVFANGKSMSQDLANSLIEYYSIDNAISFQQIKSVLEIGGGYGRNAHVILTLNPDAKVVLVDIMPALYVAQRYLSSVFKERPVFRARNFYCYDDVKEEMEKASIIFLLPHQLPLIPDQQFDLSINISSFGEMSLDQIQWYFKQINRLTSKYFYTKQWQVSKNPFDGFMLRKEDYVFFKDWHEIFSRNCAVQNEFFEMLYQVHIHDR